MGNGFVGLMSCLATAFFEGMFGICTDLTKSITAMFSKKRLQIFEKER